MERIQKTQELDALTPAYVFLGMSLLASFAFWFSGCTTYPTVRPDLEEVALLAPAGEIPESLLLDARIQVFNPGKLPSSKNASRGLTEDTRKAEAPYMAVELKGAMQQTGYWGRVRVVPAGNSGYEVLVTGEIIKSNGEELHLRVAAIDATGRTWIKGMTYKSAVDAEMARKSTNKRLEMFQNVYFRIANELGAFWQSLTPEQVREIRKVAELRFAEELVPVAFAGYLTGHTDSRYIEKATLVTVDRLPPEDDEMLSRVQQVRTRDARLVDTLDDHYEDMHHKMGDAYTNWRNLRLAEMNMIRDVDFKKNKQRTQSIALLGVGIVLGNALTNVQVPDSVVAPVVGGIAGAATAHFLNAEQISEQAEYNKAMLEDLGISFAAEVEPTLLWMEGETIKLTGSAEAKYRQWRAVLERLYQIETDTDESVESVKGHHSHLLPLPSISRNHPILNSAFYRVAVVS